MPNRLSFSLPSAIAEQQFKWQKYQASAWYRYAFWMKRAIEAMNRNDSVGGNINRKGKVDSELKWISLQ